MRFIQILLATLIPISTFAAKDWEGKWFGNSGEPLCIVVKETSTTQFAFKVSYYFGDTVEECRNAKYLRNKREYTNVEQPAKRNSESYVWGNSSYEYSRAGGQGLYGQGILEYPGTIPVEYGRSELRTCQEKFILRFDMPYNSKDHVSFHETYKDSTSYCMRGIGYGTQHITISYMTRIK